MNRSLGLFEQAARLGRCRYVELTLFSLLGTSALVAADPTEAVFLAGAARAHAWRARELEVLLPVSLGLPGVEESTSTPGLELDSALGELAAPGNEHDLVIALASTLYPAMTNAYREHLASLSPVSDPPIARVLRRVLGDLEATSDDLYVLVPDPPKVPRGRAASLPQVIQQCDGVFGPLD